VQIVKAARAMQRLALRWRKTGTRVSFVPTMGCLHDGHLSLMRRARRAAGPKGKVVVSIYVNPAQFGPREDLSRYPRNFSRDTQLCRAEGVDILFSPSTSEMYPRGKQPFSTFVVEENLSRFMEGVSRPAHFRGVATVVAKLFNLVLPDTAVFGAKDFQQAAVIRRMCADLAFPVKVVVAPTIREKDGLAMSSRNKYLKGPEREHASALFQTIRTAREIVQKSERVVSANVLKRRLASGITRLPNVRVDYIEFFDPKTLLPLTHVHRGAQMALAVFVGSTRLIDNGLL
jgi:pantoate--beta-alanine ligase